MGLWDVHTGGARWHETAGGRWGVMFPSLLSFTLGCEVVEWDGWRVCTCAGLCLPPSWWVLLNSSQRKHGDVTPLQLLWCGIFTCGEVLWDPMVILLLSTHFESKVEEAGWKNGFFFLKPTYNNTLSFPYIQWAETYWEPPVGQELGTQGWPSLLFWNIWSWYILENLPLPR